MLFQAAEIKKKVAEDFNAGERGTQMFEKLAEDLLLNMNNEQNNQ